MAREFEEESVAVAVCAREDSALLRDLILKLFLQETPGGWQSPAVVVVINDSEQQNSDIRGFVSDATPSGRLSSIVFETRRGIPFARNAALDFAHQEGFDWVGFIDDDCIPDDDWLYEICLACKQSASDGAAGAWRISPVAEPSPWIPNDYWGEKNYFVGGRPANDLDELETAYTRSVIFRRSSATGPDGTPLLFSEKLANSGGSDVEFFDALIGAGGKVVFASKSRIEEKYEGERLEFVWHVKRKIRDSQLIFEREVISMRRSTIWRAAMFFRGLASGLFGLVRPNSMEGHRAPMRQRVGEVVLRLAPVFGIALFIAGFRYHSYSNTWKFLR